MKTQGSNSPVMVPTMDDVRKAIKETIEEHAQSRNHPNATLQGKGFVILSNDVGNDSEVMAATSKAVKTAYNLANTANQNANTRLEKNKNGEDIPDKAAFVSHLGLGHAIKTGDYGIGSYNGAAIPNGDYNNAIVSGIYAGPGVNAKNSADNNTRYGPCLVLGRNYDGIYQQAHYKNEFYCRYRESGVWTDWWKVLTTATTTMDARGNIKQTSPLIQIYSSGAFTTNEESKGATVERVSEGTYLIKGILGFNTDEAVNNIEIPQCHNNLPLVWIDYEKLHDGSLKVMIYHREHLYAPIFARNVKEGYSDGDLIDIPDGRFISVRVQMPAPLDEEPQAYFCR
ncbi:pyocin knob domain-containing protein [Xenorhabdus szentirmaii]|uniref:pyocin knob domain-containing protein n=1 Tax=Xenorhabdus szentirmaii TaxID=290112 RepID=UPI000C05DFC4|nr:pyocin knob domain-containing protein [Xenorhabdus szentirmaii]PHM40448.1 tail protein [Xenorhabdus szentirmaii]